jgi:hypothetical protein
VVIAETVGTDALELAASTERGDVRSSSGTAGELLGVDPAADDGEGR